MSETKNGNGEAHDNTTSVFIGLGPAASTISEDMLRERLEEVTEVLGVRIRGRCAFADVTDAEAADKLVAELDGKMIGEARMAVQISRSKEKERPAANAGSNKHANNNNSNSSNNHNHNSSSGGGGGRTSLFVGLGPAGGAVSDNELREKLELAVPILAFRRRGQCAFVDVANMADANRMIRELNNQYIGECRLSVQYSRDNKRSRSVERRSRSPARRRRRQRSRRS
ncbi:splicing factor TSR1, partial [Trypanosoma grayi]|uniref:splicing factor TSR1 n=1 Tax=Trypanosoma grayi TaxID=71804 RepID=UPI0004F4437E